VAPHAHAPAWSPDGNAIAYITEGASYRLAGSSPGAAYATRLRDCQVWTRRPDGTHPERLLSVPRCDPGRWTNLAWSPDGSQLAVGIDYVMNANGQRLASLDLKNSPVFIGHYLGGPTW
jgi:Tol biopolymer transport system component